MDNQQPMKVNDKIPQYNEERKQQIEQLLQRSKIKASITKSIQNLYQNTQSNFQKLKDYDEQRKKRVEGIDLDMNFVKDFEEIECDIPKMKDKIQKEFPYWRPIRGDGNCLYSSLVFGFLELLLTQSTKSQQFLFELINDIYNDRISMLDMFKSDNQPLVSGKEIKIQILQFLSQIYQTKMDSDQLAKYINNINGLYEILISFIRSIALNSYDQNCESDEYKYYIEEGLKQQIQTFEEEGELITVKLICEILPISVVIFQWEHADPFQQMDPIVKNDLLGRIYLKYTPGHYALLYKEKKSQILSKQQNIDFQPLF